MGVGKDLPAPTFRVMVAALGVKVKESSAKRGWCDQIPPTLILRATKDDSAPLNPLILLYLDP